MARHDTLFSIRYAARVLERDSRFWGRIKDVLLFFSMLSGTAAIAALSAESRLFTLIAGSVFAVMQVFENTVRPADKKVGSDSTRRRYSMLIAREDSLDDKKLESAYRELVAEDEVIVCESIRHISYNDVLMEMGLDTTYLYKLTRWERFIGLLA